MTNFESIARRSRIAPLGRAVDALREAYIAGLKDARRPAAPKLKSPKGRKAYGSTPDEAVVLEAMLSWRRDGWTWQAIATELNGRIAPRRNGQPWTASAVAGVCEGRP